MRDSNNNFNQFTEALQNKGIVIHPDYFQSIEEQSSIRSIVLQVVAILGGLLAVGFFYGFLYLMFQDDVTSTMLFIIGAILLAVSAIGNYNKNLILSEGIFVASFLGGMFGCSIALYDIFSADLIFYLLIFLMNIISFLFYKSKVIQFLALIFAYAALMFFMIKNMMYEWSITTLWIILVLLFYTMKNEWYIRNKSSYYNDRYNSFVNALSFIVMCGFAIRTIENGYLNYLMFNFNHFEGEFNLIGLFITLFTLFIPLVLVYETVKMLVKRLHFKWFNVLMIICLVTTFGIVWLDSFALKNCLIGLLLLIWFFENKRRNALIGSLVFMIIAVISFYYYLEISLLFKSLMLIGTGAVFLVGYYFNQKKYEKGL